jgi:hypothetical protein
VQLILAIMLLCGSVAAALPLKRSSAPGTNGSYRAILHGALEGNANVVVTPAGVTIIGQVTDTSTGSKATFATTSLSMNNGRFNGTDVVGLKATAGRRSAAGPAP